MFLTYLLIFILSLTISSITNFVAIRLAAKMNIIDHPGQLARKDHSSPTPLSGGLGIFSAFYLTIFSGLFFLKNNFNVFTEYFPILSSYSSGIESKISYLMIISLGGLIILFLGLFDDKKGLSPLFKIFTTFSVVLFLFLMKVKLTLFLYSLPLTFMLNFAWILFMTNSFNLLDNMNGSATFSAISSAIILLIVALFLKQVFIGLYLITLIGVLTGFLFFNWPDAKAFLGDSGALFIGFTLAVISLLQTYYIKDITSPASVILPLFAFAIPCYDTLSVIIIRLKNRVPVYKGDHNHITHRINRLGVRKKNVVLITGFINILSFIIFLPFYFGGDFSVITGIIIFIINLILFYLLENFMYHLSKRLKHVKK